jgi:dTDP-glucose 4,6-dehydratase
LELAHAVNAALGSTATVQVARKAIPGVQLQQYVPSIKKAEQQLGLKCEVSLEDAIRRTAAWHGHRSETGC